MIDRRIFLAGSAAALGAGAARASIVAPGATPAQRQALAVIAAYLEAHRAHFALPAMGMVVVDGAFTAFINSGTADYRETMPLSGQELWQIGSISKSFVALVALQLASESKLDLEADIRTVMPEAALPPASDGGPFTFRGLLDHTTGLPDFAPTWPTDGTRLWRGFPAGSHWSYSNVAYGLVGDAIARIEAKPLGAVIEARVMAPLGMTASHGAILARDRARYPASFSVARPDRPLRQRNLLAPAPWVDTTFGAGSVAATLPDMAKYLRYLIEVGNGRGAPLLGDDMARLWLARPVVQDPETPAETYGLGLMHRSDEGRQLLHHTGGMVSFSSAFHTDAAAGTGAFASCAIGGTGYRPRLLTRYACQALRLAREGKPVPPPPSLAPSPLKSPAEYAGSYTGAGTTLTIAGAPGLSVAAGGRSAALEPQAPDRFVTDHPGFDAATLLFVRDKPGGAIIAIDHGSSRYVRAGVSAPLPATPARIAARAGHYQSDDPWIGGVTLVARGDQLFADGTDALVEIGDDVWRAAEPDWLPERMRFAGFVNGQPQALVFSGRTLERREG